MKLTVIIPTRNGQDSLQELLAGLSIQTLAPDEILVIDSASEDQTVEVAARYGARVHRIALDEFDHGGTRSMAARMAAGELLVFMTQDVLPASRQLLEKLVEPIVNSAEIAASYARQLPAFDADDIATHLRLFNYPEQSAVKGLNDRSRLGFQAVFLSNSCAAYRRSSLEAIGYFESNLIFGEDSTAAGKLLEQGERIAYAADARVYHSHNYSWEEEFRRYFDIGVFHRRQRWLLDTYGGASGRGVDYIRSGLTYLWRRRNYRMIGDFVVRVGLKFCGYRLGRFHTMLPPRLAERLSMNGRWWRNLAAAESKQD